MTAAAHEHSNDFARAVENEADRLRLDAERLRQEAASHLRLAERATAEAIVLERRVRELDELVGRAPQLSLDMQTEKLRGRRLREVAVEILARRGRLGEPIHYREWFELLLAEGHAVEGKSAVATFLTQVTRSPVVRRDALRPGVYRVDPHAGSDDALAEMEDAKRAVLVIRARLAGARERADESAIADHGRQLAAAERRAAAAERALSEVARTQVALRAVAASTVSPRPVRSHS